MGKELDKGYLVHIVIIDSSQVIVSYAVKLLVDQGYTVNGFTDGGLAYDYISSHMDVELLITGLELKTMPGLELIWNVRADLQRTNPIFIIAMSSSSEKKAVVQALDSGADDFISKPFDKIELFARVRSAERVLTMQKGLVELATKDALTGLLNRGAFLRQANLCIEEQCCNPVIFVMIDIDHFKCINDQYGHSTGDLVLQSVAELLKLNETLVGRIGGEEFGILLKEKNIQQAACKMEELRTNIERTVFSNDHLEVKCTCSFGIASVAQLETTIEGAYLRADRALYSSKNSGRNKITIFEETRKSGI